MLKLFVGIQNVLDSIGAFGRATVATPLTRPGEVTPPPNPSPEGGQRQGGSLVSCGGQKSQKKLQNFTDRGKSEVQ